MGFDVGFYGVLEQAAKAREMTLTDVGRKMGKGSSYVLNNRNRGSVPSVDNAARMLDACSYVLAAMPRDALPVGALVVEPPPVDGAAAERKALERKRAKLASELADLDKRLG